MFSFFFFSSRRRHTRSLRDWSSDVCSSDLSFSAAEENFHTAARQGIDAEVFWPGVGTARATELVLRRLLPLAVRGLDAWGVDVAVRDRLLGIIEQRCLTGRNGASWQADEFHR